jgi:hypothetical protein
MNFRLKACGVHLLGSACGMAIVLGALYLGWYRWPGWYLTGAAQIALMAAGFDVVLGPLLTLIVAGPAKPRSLLIRDISIIVCVQVIAAAYGATTLWKGRVLYYTYSEKWLEMVQASDLAPEQIALGEKLNPDFAPHWYSLPRWVYVPMPDDPKFRDQVVQNSISGGDDVIQMPRYFKPWEAGLANLRKDLRAVGQMGEFSPSEQKLLKERMKQMGLAPDVPAALPLMGRTRPLLAVLDPKTLRINALISPD